MYQIIFYRKGRQVHVQTYRDQMERANDALNAARYFQKHEQADEWEFVMVENPARATLNNGR